MITLYHSADMDGHCSGAIVKKANPGTRLWGINYGKPIPWDKVSKGETVVFVDWCPEPKEDMDRLVKDLGCEVILIDHHASAIAKIEEWGYGDLKGKREIGKAGCELAWEFFLPNLNMPRIVSWIGRYDVWDQEAQKKLPLFELQEGLRRFDTRPTNEAFWYSVLSKTSSKRVDDIVTDGKLLLEVKTKDNESYINSAGFDLEWEGLKLICVNRLMTNSRIFASKWNHESYDAMLTFGFRNNTWQVSLYTDKPGVNVGQIAVKHGGGGHLQAAGFNSPILPFPLPIMLPAMAIEE